MLNVLLNGAKSKDNHGRGRAVKFNGNGDGFSNAVVVGAFGVRCRGSRHVVSFSLTVRVATIMAVVLNMLGSSSVGCMVANTVLRRCMSRMYTANRKDYET